MEKTENTSKKKFDLTSYGIVVGFLAMEVLAFFSFYLGHSFIFYGILSAVLAVLLVLVTLRQISKDGVATFAFFLFPLFVFGLLTALSPFNASSLGHISTAETVFIPIALTFIAIAGFLTAYIEKFNIKMTLLIVYGALALFVLINLIITMVYYVPFYTLIYKNSYIFYDGKPSALPIGKMAYMLFGFKATEVKLEYWSLFPSLLMTAVIPLFFIKYKENRRDFILYAVMSGIAFLSLLFTISRITLISDIILVLGIAIIIVAAKFKKARPILNVMVATIGAIALLFIIITFFIAQDLNSGFAKLFIGNSLLNRLFIANGLSNRVIIVFQDLLNSKYGFFKLFGAAVDVMSFDPFYPPNGVVQKLSGFWLFDNVLTSGLFGAIFFMFALVLGIRRLFIYIGRFQEDDSVKYTIAGYTLGFLAISILLLDVRPLVNSDSMFPFFICAPLLIVIFLLSYVFNKTLSLPKKSKVVAQEQPVEEKEEVIEDEETITL